jgi:hypothetical protein
MHFPQTWYGRLLLALSLMLTLSLVTGWVLATRYPVQHTSTRSHLALKGGRLRVAISATDMNPDFLRGFVEGTSPKLQKDSRYRPSWISPKPRATAAATPARTLPNVVFIPLAPFAVAAIALTVFLLTLSSRRPAPPGHCPACRYDIRRIASGRCPECGAEFPATLRNLLIRAGLRLRRASLSPLLRSPA